MGFFSWYTADTEQSIPNDYAAHERAGTPFYLLQPNGKGNIKIEGYEGYGRGAGIDFYEWLSEVNFGLKRPDWGIALECDTRLIKHGKHYYYCTMHLSKEFINVLKEKLKTSDQDASFIGINTYADEFLLITADGENLSTTLNDLREMDSATSVGVKEIIGDYLPLKFSYNPNAVYEDLNASDQCDFQGYFYD